MKRKACSLTVLLALLLALSCNAVAAQGGDYSIQWDKTTSCTTSLSFSGNTANCSASIRAKQSTSRITATMILYRLGTNGTPIEVTRWSNLTGTGRLNVSRTYSPAISGVTYRLVVNATVSDSAGSEPVSANQQKVCP